MARTLWSSSRLCAALVLVLAACSATGAPGVTVDTVGASPASSAEALGELTWTQVDPDPGSDEGPMAVVGWGSGLLGVGSGRTWSSPDGVVWTAGAEPLADQWGLADLIAFDDRTIAAGQLGSTATLWTTTDGLTWAASDDPDLVAVAPYQQTRVERLVAGPTGLLAVGTEFGDGGQRPVAFWSADGADWFRTAGPLVGNGLRHAATDGATWVGVGAATVPAEELTKAAFWTSPDGRSWTEISDDGDRLRTEPSAVAWTGDRFVAVGFAATLDTGGPAFRPQAWLSQDGSRWAMVAPTADTSIWPFPGPTPVANESAFWGGMMVDLVAIPGALLAVGNYWGPDPGIANKDGLHTAMAYRGVAWTSTDGTEWTLGQNSIFTAPATPGDEQGTMRYALRRVTMVEGHPIVTGIVPGAGSVVWTGSLAP